MGGAHGERRYWAAMHYGLRLIALFMLLSLYGSARRYVVDPITAHRITIKAERLKRPQLNLTPQLRYVDGWSLSSDDKDFGGLSALAFDRGTFVAISDIGAVIRFSLGAGGDFGAASISHLPSGCARDGDKFDRDSESITFDPATRTSWIGFEWRNAICRSGAAMKTADIISQPEAMKSWSRTGGPEAMVRLSDGRFLIFAEFAPGESALPPLLIYDRDPTDPDAKVQTRTYQPPEHHFSPTDALQLADGRLLVLNRRFEPPFYFSARLSIIDPIAARPSGIISGKTIASFGRPGLTSNFEGITVSYEDGRAFVWIVSDDNYMWIEKTYLLKFELLSKP